MAAKLKAVPTTDTPFSEPTAETVTLGEQTYTLREIPLGRVKRLRSVWVDFFTKINGIVTAGDWMSEEATDAIFGLVEDKPGELLAIFIPGFDVTVMDDEDNGPTIPQVIHALNRGLEVNGLNFLKKIVPFVQERQRMTALTNAIRQGEITVKRMEAAGESD